MGKKMEEKNKYQEALNNIKLEILNCGCCEGDYDKNICKTKCEKQKDILLLQKLVDKEKPKDVEYTEYDGFADGYPVYDTAICPNCDREFEVECEEHYDYCPTCGQKIKW